MDKRPRLPSVPFPHLPRKYDEPFPTLRIIEESLPSTFGSPSFRCPPTNPVLIPAVLARSQVSQVASEVVPLTPPFLAMLLPR